MGDSRTLPQLSNLVGSKTQFSIKNVIHNDNICTLYWPGSCKLSYSNSRWPNHVTQWFLFDLTLKRLKLTTQIENDMGYWCV